MTNQSRVTAWVRTVFTEKEATDVPERALRMAEEALELAQACEVDAATLHRLVDYVMSRPVGKPAQEIAGTMVTLYALAGALGVDADAEFETELVRIQQPEVIERCQRRQHEKRAALAAKPEQYTDNAFENFEIHSRRHGFPPFETKRYGIRVNHESWVTINGGPDLVGTKDQSEAAAKLLRAELSGDEKFTYEPAPYTGNDPADTATVEGYLARMESLIPASPTLLADDLVKDSREQLGDFCDDGKTGALR